MGCLGQPTLTFTPLKLRFKTVQVRVMVRVRWNMRSLEKVQGYSQRKGVNHKYKSTSVKGKGGLFRLE